MRFHKSFAFKTMAVASAMILSFSSAAFAMSYKDIPANHWAYAAIDEVSNRGVLVGDLSGNFKPDAFIDKFETSKILAKMAGYQYADVSAEEQLYYDRCYENNKSFINQFSSKFSKWNDTYNKEIAFLLEKEILTEEDLNQFIVIINNEERLRALSREEACLYLTKVMGKTEEAAAVKPSALFNDDASITALNRPYVYYFRQLGIVNGDNNNNFNPKSATTKAAMAILLQSVYKNMGAAAIPVPDTQPGQNTPMETVLGTIAKLFPTARAIQVSSENDKFNNKIYIVSSTASVNVNGFVKTYADLAEGMSFTGVFSGNELISITTSEEAPPVSAPPVNTAPSSPVTPPANQALAEGIITAVDMDANTIDFETRTISPRGEITADIRTYAVAGDASITRSGAAAALSSVVKGDIAAIQISGTAVSRIELHDKDVAFTGTLTEKSFNAASGIPFLVVTDANGTIYKFTLTNATVITRKDVDAATWSDLRVGDAVDIAAEYEVLKTVHAAGTKSSVDAWVKDIYISSAISKVTAVDSNNREKIYPIIGGAADPYALRVGSKVRFRLDSAEVESFTVLEDSQATSVTGKITNILNSTVSLSATGAGYASVRAFKYDSKTVIVDSRTGKTVSANYLDADMSVYVVFGETSRDYAKTITILGY